MEENNLHEVYTEKATELKAKYKNLINALSIKHDKDLGVAYDMLRAIARGNEEYGEGLEYNLEEIKKDFGELADLGEMIAQKEGLV